MKVIANQHDTLDLICWRIFGKTSGVVEETIKLNPHVSKSGSILEQGTTIVLPDLIPVTQELKMINLWD